MILREKKTGGQKEYLIAVCDIMLLDEEDSSCSNLIQIFCFKNGVSGLRL